MESRTQVVLEGSRRSTDRDRYMWVDIGGRRSSFLIYSGFLRKEEIE